MARIRTIKPEFWKHEILSELPEPTHMLAAALLNYADDEGYFNANPNLIKAECSPLREPSVSIQCSLSELSRIGYIEVSGGTDGRSYGRIVKFSEHQKVNRPNPSKIKHLAKFSESSVSPHGSITEDSLPEKEKEKEKEGNGVAAAPRPRFSPPSLEEVRSHCATKGSSIDPETFWNYYQANGWVQGRGKPIKDWKACVTTWEKNTFGGNARGSPAPAESIYKPAKMPPRE